MVFMSSPVWKWLDLNSPKFPESRIGIPIGGLKLYLFISWERIDNSEKKTVKNDKILIKKFIRQILS